MDPLHEAANAEAWPAISPDGRWLAYGASVSDPANPTVRSEVYVRPFPGPGPTVPVSAGGGLAPAWNPKGGELFYSTARDGNGKQSMVAVEFNAANRPVLGRARPLFSYDPNELWFDTMPLVGFSVAPDGQHFYATRYAKAPPPPVVSHINLMPNWFDELKAKAPVR